MGVVGECFFWYRLTRGCPVQILQSRKTVVCVCVCVCLELTSEQQTVDKGRDEMESFGVRGVERQPRCRETSAITTPSASKLRAL